MQTQTHKNGNGHNKPYALAAEVRRELEKLKKPGRPSHQVLELRAQLAQLENEEQKLTKKTPKVIFEAPVVDEEKPKRGRKAKEHSEFEIVVDKNEKVSKRTIYIPPIVQEVIEVVVEGTSDCIQHAWDPKTIRQMEEDQTKTVDRETRAKRPPRVPEAEYNAARYIDADGNDCAPAVQFKKCMVAAAGMLKGATTSNINSCVFVKGTGKNFNLVPLKHANKKPVMRTDMVKVGKFPNKQATPRYRPAYINWSCTLRIEFIPSVISAEQVVNLLDWGGFTKGIAEWRPERGGEFGRFRVKAVRGVK